MQKVQVSQSWQAYVEGRTLSDLELYPIREWRPFFIDEHGTASHTEDARINRLLLTDETPRAFVYSSLTTGRL